MGWHRCTLCRNSSTARTAIIDPDSDVDLSVFIQPQNSTAAAAAAATESSSSDLIPRHVVIKMMIKRHQEKNDEFESDMGRLIHQLFICQNRCQ
ncbi:MAG: hypothetical protein ACKPKO_49485, partial [Candidatus Fonsibacter sp.]